MKKKLIALVTAISLATGLTACVSPPGATGKAIDGTTTVESNTLNEKAAALDAVDDNPITEVKTSYKSKAFEGNSEEDTVIEERIDKVGEEYDGLLTSYGDDNATPQQVVYAINDANFCIEYAEMQRDREEAEDKLNELLSYYREIDVYEPKEDTDIVIFDGKVHEYNKADSDTIVSLMKDIYYLCNTMMYKESTMKDYDEVCIEPSMITNNAMTIQDEIILGDEKMQSDETSSETSPYTEEYASYKENRFLSVADNPFSTFGMDVDTASYTNLRRMLFENRIQSINIPEDSIRTEEALNYFDYDKIKADDKFGIMSEISDTPWNDETKLLRIAVQAEKKNVDDVKSNIVFLIDTSGSMFDTNKLPLVQKAFLSVLSNLNEYDIISIVTYAGDSSIHLEGVTGDEKEKITKEIARLEANGRTNGAQGISTAYDLAEKYYIKDGNNRVILATDGDINLGPSSESDLVELIKKKKDTGVFLSVIGVGEGNYKDSKLKALASNGNGNYSYIDSTREAKKALEKDFDTFAYTVAKDAKMQVEFNPAKIKGYRQIGYEYRQLETEDFADDTVDGAEIGSNQHVTVLYEIIPIDSTMDLGKTQSRYVQTVELTKEAQTSNEWATVSIRYKEPDDLKSHLLQASVTEDHCTEEMSDDMSWAAGVAQTMMLLRDSEYKGTSDYNDIYERLKKDKNIMEDDSKAEFLYMLKGIITDTRKTD